jgi:hypothetical protein
MVNAEGLETHSSAQNLGQGSKQGYDIPPPRGVAHAADSPDLSSQ